MRQYPPAKAPIPEVLHMLKCRHCGACVGYVREYLVSEVYRPSCPSCAITEWHLEYTDDSAPFVVEHGADGKPEAVRRRWCALTDAERAHLVSLATIQPPFVRAGRDD